MSNLISASEAKQMTALVLEKINEERNKKIQKEIQSILVYIGDTINDTIKRGKYQISCTLNSPHASVINEVLNELVNLGYKCEYKNSVSMDPYIRISWE